MIWTYIETMVKLHSVGLVGANLIWPMNKWCHFLVSPKAITLHSPCPDPLSPPPPQCFAAARQGSRTNVVMSWPTHVITSVRMRGCAQSLPLTNHAASRSLTFPATPKAPFPPTPAHSPSGFISAPVYVFHISALLAHFLLLLSPASYPSTHSIFPTHLQGSISMW